MKTFKVGSDIGDAIAALCICRHLGGGHIRLYGTPGTKGFDDTRYNALRPLIDGQPWATSVARFDEAEGLEITHDFTGFRDRFGDGDSLIEKQARWIGLPHNSVDTSPWLTIPDVPKHNKIVLCRSQRCLGAFQWFRLFHRSKDCVFVGLKEDYDLFCLDNSPWPAHKRSMPKIEFLATPNLLEAAKIIKGARLFICNQTSLLWVAFAMGITPMIVEKVNEDSYLPMEGRRFIASADQNPSIKEFSKL